MPQPLGRRPPLGGQACGAVGGRSNISRSPSHQAATVLPNRWRSCSTGSDTVILRRGRRPDLTIDGGRTTSLNGIRRRCTREPAIPDVDVREIAAPNATTPGR